MYGPVGIVNISMAEIGKMQLATKIPHFGEACGILE